MCSASFGQASEICSHWIKFTIEDTGIGIAPEDQEQIFAAFHQVDNSLARLAGGTGLGLPLARHIVQDVLKKLPSLNPT